jgi:hypothetical protein
VGSHRIGTGSKNNSAASFVGLNVAVAAARLGFSKSMIRSARHELSLDVRR